MLPLIRQIGQCSGSLVSEVLLQAEGTWPVACLMQYALVTGKQTKASLVKKQSPALLVHI
jgi:hypothetical protein